MWPQDSLTRIHCRQLAAARRTELVVLLDDSEVRRAVGTPLVRAFSGARASRRTGSRLVVRGQGGCKAPDVPTPIDGRTPRTQRTTANLPLRGSAASSVLKGERD